MPLLKKSTQDKEKSKGLFGWLSQKMRQRKDQAKPFSGSIGAGRDAILKHKNRLKEMEKKMGR